MRLTLVISSLERGGAERVMSVLASAWAGQGHQVTLLSLDRDRVPAYPLHPAVKLKHLGLLDVSTHIFQALWRNVARIRGLRRAIGESQPQLVISFMDRVNVLTLLATRRLGVPVIISERIDPSQYDIGRAWHFLRRRVYPSADALVCQTAGALARFQAMSRVRGFVIPNPVVVPDGLAARSPVDRKNSLRRELIAMGRLVPQKGFDLLLQAFSRIAPQHPDWTVTILGSGPLLAQLEAQARSSGLEGRVAFAGAVADPFVRLRNADLFVFSSRFEGFGMALAEAMACGLPVISFDCPEGPSVIVRNGVDGILVPAEHVGALAEVLDRLMRDSQERNRLAARAPEVLDRFSVDKILPLWQHLFDRVLPANRRPLAE